MAQQEHRVSYRITKAMELNYLLHLPEGYGAEGGRAWPLILFLHGAGERGDDFGLLKRHGIPKLADEGRDLPFVAVSPQCPEGCTWWMMFDAVMALLDEASRNLAVDRRRLYLTGLSMGGYGTWHLATLHPDRFAAIAPICGGGFALYGFPERVCALKHVPVWAFHGAKDPAVLLEESEKMVDALRACGGQVRFTVYPEAEHDSWTEAYDTPELYSWFLSHSL